MSEETVKSRLSKLREIDGKADKTTDVLSKPSDELENESAFTSDVKGDSKMSQQSRRTYKVTHSYPAAIQWMLDHKGIICGIAIFLIYVLVQMKYVYEVWFDPDELDIYSVAFEMFKGKVLYRDIPSQHMPWTYIISWIFYILGAHTAFLQRLYFYILFAGFWTSFIFIYKKYVNKWALVIQPFIYLAVIQHIDFATQILSEHLQVIGFQIFLLEFLMFLKKRDVSLGSCIRMMFGVLFTFGTAFLSVYPLFFMFLGVVFMEIKWALEDGTSMKDFWSASHLRMKCFS